MSRGSPGPAPTRYTVMAVRMAHPLGMSLFVADKNGKRAKKDHSLLEAVVVPVASSALVTTAAIRSIRNGHQDDGPRGGPEGQNPPRRARRARPGDENPSPLDRLARKAPFLKPVAAGQRRYGEGGGNQLAAALTPPAVPLNFPPILL